MSTDNDFKVICASLSKHVNTSTSINTNNISVNEIQLLQLHRKKLVRSAVRHISCTIGQINKLSNMLASIYVIQKVINKESIPSFFATAEFWGACQQLVSTLNGKHTQLKNSNADDDTITNKNKKMKQVKTPTIDTDEMIRQKIEQIQNKLLDAQNDDNKVNQNKKRKRTTNSSSLSSPQPTQLSVYDQRMIAAYNEKLKIPYEQRLKEEIAKKEAEKQSKIDVRPIVKRELYACLQSMKEEFSQSNESSAPFEFPARDHLSAFLDSEKLKQVTLVNNHFMTNFFNRQLKTVKAQVQIFINQHKQILLPLEKQISPENNESNLLNKITAAAIKWCIASINRNKNMNDVQTSTEASFNYKQIVSQFPEVIKKQLENLVSEHQSVLPESTEQIYEKNVGDKCYLYIPYFYYLWQQLKHVNDKSFKSFPILPQLTFKCPFIDIRAKSVDNLRGFCATENWKTIYKQQIIEQEKDETIKNHLKKAVELYGTKLSWISSLSKSKENIQNLVQQLIQHPKNTPSIQFENNCLSDGQQIRFRYKKVINVTQNTNKSKNKRSKEIRTLEMNHLKPGVYNAQDKSIKFKYLKENTNNYPTIISIDPGRVDLITAVCHNVNKMKSDENDKMSDINDNRLKVSKGKKRRLAKQARELKSKQSVYQLSNKQYYQMAGFVEARLKRQKWRTCSGLTDLDLLLSKQNYSSRTFDMNTYLGYIRTVCSSKWWSKQWQYVSLPCHSKLSFASYQQKQRALITIARQLVAKTGQTINFNTHQMNQIQNNQILSKPQVVLLWGNGSFPSSGTGHAAAPNKGLYMELSKYFPIIITDENYSSQTTACCVKYVKHAYWNHNPKYINKKNDQKLAAARDEEENGKNKINVKDLKLVDFTNPARKIRSLFYCKQSSTVHSISNIKPSIDCCCFHPNRSSRPWNRDVSSALNIFRIFRMNHQL